MNYFLKCPKCLSDSGFSVIETLSAETKCEGITSSGPEYTSDTKVIYESARVEGVVCQCGFSFSGPDWVKNLRP